MEMNKLKLATHKCGKIHIGKESSECPTLKVHEEVMKDSDSEKYLGDIISNKGTLDMTIKDRKLKGYSYISEIRALLSDMPFGHRRIEVGLMLRDAMFVNGILTNSEAWHSISKKNIEDLEVMDRSLLRYITGAHAKTQNEFLYLETGALNIEQTIANRRMMYLQTLLKRPENEITKKVYKSQKKNPVKGDWVDMVKKDFANIEMEMIEEAIQSESKLVYKNRVKKHIRMYMLSELKKKQEGHNKISNICYNDLKTQEYLKTHMLNNHEVFLLFSLRSRNAKQFKANFPYNIDQICPMQGCYEVDTQERCLVCEKNILTSNTIKYEGIFSDTIEKQVAVTKLFASLLERREDASAYTAGPMCCPVSLEDGGCSDACLSI